MMHALPAKPFKTYRPAAGQHLPERIIPRSIICDAKEGETGK